MKFVADLHIHSHFSRATSRALDPEHLSLWAQKKGIGVVGTGDFTHPGWVSELQDKLTEAEEGLYQLRPDLHNAINSQVPSPCQSKTRFLLSGEISCIYKKDGRTRKVHHLILMPDMASVIKLNTRLAQIGNISSDGRPILGLDSRNLLEITLEIDERAFFVPAHIWTPWFSIFGSKSGFDTLEECFEDLTGHIHALETGLSSDPPMNRRISSLDHYVLVSNSDAHSPGKLGREANLFDTHMEYHHMIQALTHGKGFIGTIEFFPEEGKYHLDGHRKCQLRLHPAQTCELQGVCPVCGRHVTVGVLNRVDELSDRHTPVLSKDFFSLIPLPEVLSELLDCGPSTKKVMAVYERLLSRLGPELTILMDTPLSDIEAAAGPLLAEAVRRMRQNQVIRAGGYDGEFGAIRLFEDSERQAIAGQMALFTQRTKPPPTEPGFPLPGTKRPKKTKIPMEQQPLVPKDPILDPLNPEQKSAVLHEGRHLLVVAGPGTGKTMTLAHRIAHLIEAGLASPGKILALTFTRKAAREMSERISALVQGSEPNEVRVATFHGFCLELLRREGDKTGLPPNFGLCSELDVEKLATEVLEISGVGTRSVRKLLKALPTMKRACVLGSFSKEEEADTLLSLFDKYQHRLRALGMLDLDDLEVEALSLLRTHPEISEAYSKRFPWIFVDEYQDTNAAQVELLKILIRAGSGTICAIGDPDQAIYGFRGADVRNFHRFHEDFPGAREIHLTKNYRSTRCILQGAASLMGKARPLQGESLGEDLIFLAPCRTESEEAEMVVEQVERLIGGISYFSLDSGRVASSEGEPSLGFGDIGVLYRLNAQGDALEQAIDRAGIPFVRSGETPLIHAYPLNILWSFFQTLRYPNNTFYAKKYQSLLSHYCLKGKGPVETFSTGGCLSDLIDRALAFHEVDPQPDEPAEAVNTLKHLAGNFRGDLASFLDVLSLDRGIDHGALAGDRVALMSIHAAKGLEWPVVFITGCEDQLLPCSLFGNREEEEEKRLFYVGMTRARTRLILSHVNLRFLSGRVLHMKPSAFLEAIPQELLGLLDRRGWKRKKRPHTQLKLF
jgi:DNA helicase-2/ATP-dependent DNA helicase PcrA